MESSEKGMEENVFVTHSSMPPYEEYVEAIKPLWNSHWLTNMGEYHQELEKELKGYLDVSEISLMVNGHMALELALQAFAFPEGSEVITTPFTFISTTHAIVRNRLEPVFCDIKRTDGTIDEERIEALITDKTRAILPVHVYGNVCNVEAIEKIAQKYKLKVIYDAAHAFGVRYKDRGIGSYGDASVFSFHATKVFNTIEGGAVAFTGHEMYEKLYSLKNFGIQGEELVSGIGANAKMNEFSAIMGLCNLKHIDSTIRERKQNYDFYIEHLRDIPGIRFFRERQDTVKNYAYFPLLIEDEYGISRNELYQLFLKHHIYPRKYFYPLTADQACFKDKYKNERLENARELSERVLTIPFYPGMALEKMKEIVNIIRGRGVNNRVGD